MSKRIAKIGTAAALGGGMLFGINLFGGGCGGFGLGNGKFLGSVLSDLALHTAWEFVLDNDAVFDLFQDDFGTGTQYDDRFTDTATRAEPTDQSQADVDANVTGRP